MKRHQPDEPDPGRDCVADGRMRFRRALQRRGKCRSMRRANSKLSTCRRCPASNCSSRCDLSGPAPQPLSFTIDNPARISFDLPNIGLGAAVAAHRRASGGAGHHSRGRRQGPHAPRPQSRQARAVRHARRRQQHHRDARLLEPQMSAAVDRARQRSGTRPRRPPPHAPSAASTFAAAPTAPAASS